MYIKETWRNGQLLKINALHRKSAFGGRLSGRFCITLAQISATIKQIYR
jgi:hypothetical protein